MKILTSSLPRILTIALVAASFGVSTPVHAGQPKMEAALAAAENARAHLIAAEDDKGGHRAKAIELLDAAIAQIKEGIKFAR